jgi:hypothetical protein
VALMGWPQYTMIAIWVIGAIAALIVHGKPRENSNAVTTWVSIFISAILLSAGGFWQAYQ